MANFLEKGAPGLQTIARLVEDGKFWELNGEKVWATNSAGWDFGGADLSCVVCRDVTEPSEPDSDPKDAVMILLVTRADIDSNEPGAFQVLRHVETVGLPSVSDPHIRYTNVRVPAGNVLCPPGQGGQIAMATLDSSAVLVAAMAVGMMHCAFDAALKFADCHASPTFLELANSTSPVIQASVTQNTHGLNHHVATDIQDEACKYQRGLFRSGAFYLDQWVRSLSVLLKLKNQEACAQSPQAKPHSYRVMCRYPSQTVFRLYRMTRSLPFCSLTPPIL